MIQIICRNEIITVNNLCNYSAVHTVWAAE